MARGRANTEDFRAMFTREELTLAVAVGLDVSMSTLDARGLAPKGMTATRIRHFLNTVCRRLGSACRYLEVGTFKGATAISASYGNAGRFVTIDSFAQFHKQNAQGELAGILQSYSDVCHIEFIEGDCWEVVKTLPRDTFNVYLYDGNHGPQSQRRAFVEFLPVLEGRFIAMVDDYNAPQVQEGTANGIEEAGLTIVEDWKFTHKGKQPEGWHNGFYIAVLEK